ncbi:MAG: hypothetical protein DK306_002257 [Chloroflexi bacterium]|nr:MAG: hypothetical protein DK306_002257 [Chloroflexota bacterium]
MHLVGVDNLLLGNAIPLAALGGDPAPGVWTEYRVALDASGLNVGPGPISGLVLQDYIGTPHPPVFLDELAFH